MSQLFFILNAPSLSFSKVNLYEKKSILKDSAPFIKSVADSFFLSNQFRKHLFLYYCTSFQEKPYVITFDGSKLRYLGPSFFSAAHLLLRAKNHIINPNSRNGKLTPGISVFEQDSSWVFEQHKDGKIVQVVTSSKERDELSKDEVKQNNVFAYGFEKLPLSIKTYTMYLKQLEIDEQVIIINYLLESD